MPKRTKIKQVDVYGCKVNSLGRALNCKIDITYESDDGRIGLDDMETHKVSRLDVSKVL